MTEKERLEPILYESPELLHRSLYSEAETEKLLDRLIERGVRVQRLIPEAETLPFHPTNADLVRLMNNKRLARLLSTSCYGCPVDRCALHNYASGGCEEAFANWLSQPVSDTEELYHELIGLRPDENTAKLAKLIGRFFGNVLSPAGVITVTNTLIRNGVTVQSVSEWIPNDSDYNHCSKCGYEWDCVEYVTPFCPNCGSNMDPEFLEDE